MKILNKPRGSGKTTRLIYISEMTNFPIIVQTQREVESIKKLAEKIKCEIPTPMTVIQFQNQRDKTDILIDDGLSIIEEALRHYFQCNVKVLTMTNDCK